MGLRHSPHWKEKQEAMKTAKPLDAITLALQPGTVAREGFLGSDSRSLADILAADQAAVERLHLSHPQIARRMKELRDAGQKGLGDWIVIPPQWEARVDAVRGHLPCPFGDPGLYSKTLIAVRNTRLGMEIVYSDLLIHLIEEHGFYEGRGSPFRLDPERIAAALGL